MLLPKQLSRSLLFGFSMFVLACSGTTEEKSTQVTPEMVPLTPEGYQVMATDTLATNDRTFVINVLHLSDEDSLIEEMQELARPLVILEKKGDDYELLERNDHVILCGICGGMMGDPWDGLYLEDNAFTVYHAGGSSHRWTRNIKFQYNAEKEGWFMTSDRGGSYSSFDPQNTFEMSIYTEGDSLGTVPFAEFETRF